MAARLTGRQLQVLEGIAAGKTTTAIGRELGIGVDAVKAHRRVIFRKLDAVNAPHAVSVAYGAGLLPRRLTTQQP